MGVKCSFGRCGKCKCRLRNKRHTRTNAAVTRTSHIIITAATITWFSCVNTSIFGQHVRHAYSMVHYSLRCLIMQFAGGFIDRHNTTQRQHHHHGNEDPVKNAACIYVHILIIVLAISLSKLYMINLHAFCLIWGHINPVKFQFGATVKYTSSAWGIVTSLFYLSNSNSYLFVIEK